MGLGAALAHGRLESMILLVLACVAILSVSGPVPRLARRKAR